MVGAGERLGNARQFMQLTEEVVLKFSPLVTVYTGWESKPWYKIIVNLVKLGQTFSTWMGVSAGVPQGSLLGPLLFNIFMNDLVFAIKDCRLINYADDSKLYLSHQDPLVVQDGINQDLANTIQWFQQSGMIANPEKYQAVVLGNTAHDFEIKCSEELIPISNEIKLLGVTLDKKLKFDSHIRSICRKIGGQVNALNRLKNILPCIYSSPLSLLQPDMAPLWGKEY